MSDAGEVQSPANHRKCFSFASIIQKWNGVAKPSSKRKPQKSKPASAASASAASSAAWNAQFDAYRAHASAIAAAAGSFARRYATPTTWRQCARFWAAQVKKGLCRWLDDHRRTSSARCLSAVLSSKPDGRSCAPHGRRASAGHGSPRKPISGTVASTSFPRSCAARASAASVVPAATRATRSAPTALVSVAATSSS